MKASLISQLFLSSKFFQKSYSTLSKWIPKSAELSKHWIKIKSINQTNICTCTLKSILGVVDGASGL